MWNVQIHVKSISTFKPQYKSDNVILIAGPTVFTGYHLDTKRGTLSIYITKNSDHNNVMTHSAIILGWRKKHFRTHILHKNVENVLFFPAGPKYLLPLYIQPKQSSQSKQNNIRKQNCTSTLQTSEASSHVGGHLSCTGTKSLEMKWERHNLKIDSLLYTRRLVNTAPSPHVSTSVALVTPAQPPQTTLTLTPRCAWD